MFRIRSLMAVALMLGLVAMVACGGSEASQQETASGSESSTAMAEGQNAEAQQAESLPEGVTAEMVAQGKEIFAGAGLCYVCHGGDGTGMPGLGANLIDDEWTQSDGSYEGIVGSVMDGVDASAATTGTAMPPKGGSGITDDQVKAVAAFVFTLGK